MPRKQFPKNKPKFRKVDARVYMSDDQIWLTIDKRRKVVPAPEIHQTP